MERLWAPWRLDYIKAAAAEPGAAEAPGCIFCRFPAEARDRENLIVDRDRHSFAILNRFPYNNGHLMVVPLAHVADPALLSPEVWSAVGDHLRFSMGVMRALYRADGYNVGMNLGRTAGAGIADHLHWHIVPRWNGDTNFMPVLGATKVISEHLERTWDALAEAFAAARRP